MPVRSVLRYVRLSRGGRRLATVGIAGAIAAAGVLAVPGGAAEATPSSCSTFQEDAHRGYHPTGVGENTLAAYDAAYSRGYQIETDVRPDAQGQMWMFHDPDAFRATGTHGQIASMTTEQVSQLRYLKGKQPVATLEQAIAAWQGYPSTKIYMEPKTVSAAQVAGQELSAAGEVANRVYFTSQAPYVHSNFPALKLYYRSGTTIQDPTVLASQGYQIAGINPGQITTDLVDSYHAAGLEVHSKTTDNKADWHDIIAAGGDGVLTDFPNLLAAYCPVALAPPRIDSFSPGSGHVGDSVVITGFNFSDVSAVRFGSSSTTFAINSDSQITAQVPQNVSGDVSITLTNENGDTVSSTTYSVPLLISSFSPTSGLRGDPVVITGEGFTGTTQVRFNDVLATFTIDSPTQITAIVPQNAATSSKILVKTPGGSVRAATAYKISTTTPLVSSFSPTTGPVGTSVVLTGRNFTGASSVKFGSVEAAYNVDSVTQITAIVPQGAPASSTISVTTSVATAGSTSTFQVYTPTPSISSFSPGTGPVGSSVVLTGSNFTGASSVTFGSVAAAFTVDSATQITATVPQGAPAASTISVATSGGTAVSSATFQAYTPTPAVSSFSPGTGPVGTSVVLTGVYFTGASSVTFGSVAAAFTVDSDTQITATVPQGAPASSKIAVTTSFGTAESSSAFQVTTPAPSISSFSPATGSPGGTVVVTGTNLTGATTVKFGSVVATFDVDSDTQITTTVPQGAPAASKISIKTAGGTAVSASTFKIVPTIVSFTPNSAAPGATVVITGSAFTGTTLVKFGTVTATFTVDSDTQISAVVPQGLPASSKIRISTPGGSVLSTDSFSPTPA